MPTRTTRDDSRIRLEWHAGRYLHLVDERSSQHRADLAAEQLAILNEALAWLVSAQLGHGTFGRSPKYR
jgi:hypothetical protein